VVLRAQQAREEVVHLNKNFNALLLQDAKRRSRDGTDDVPAMSPQELKETFRAVNRDYSKMMKSVINATDTPTVSKK
jgi:hypothetical protein